MADNDIGIRITGDISDITSALSDLVSQLGEITDKVVSLVVETDTTSLTEVTTASESASNELQGVGDSAQSAGENIKSVDSTPIQEVDKAALSAADGIQVFAGAAAAIGGITLFKDLVSSAGEYEDTMERMGVATGVGVNNASAAWNNTINEIRSATGRGAGVIRKFITQMGVVGVTSADTIEKSFSGIAGTAYITGKGIDEITNAYKRVVITGMMGNRQLNALGLTTDDIYEKTGMTVEEFSEKLKAMDSESRAALVGQILYQKYGISGNQAYMMSWQHVTDALSRAWDYLSRIVGGLILPVVIPAIEFLTSTLSGLADYINGLNPLSRGLLGAVVLLGGGFVILATTLGSLVTIIKALNIVESLNTLIITTKTYAYKALELSIATGAKIYEILTGIINTNTIAEAKNIIVMGAKRAAMVAEIVVTKAVTAAQLAWNFAMMANPIGLVIVAVAALVAGLYILYQNNEQVRDSINGLWDSLVGLGEWIGGGFMNALGGIVAPFQQLYNNIVGFGGDLYNAGKEWIGNLIKGMQDSIPSLDSVLKSIGDYFPHSPAKTGPLSDITPDSMKSYGKDLGMGLSDGLNEVGIVNSAKGSGFSGMLEDLRAIAGNPKTWIGGLVTVLPAMLNHRNQLISKEQEWIDKINQRRAVETNAYTSAISELETVDSATTAYLDHTAMSTMNTMQSVEYMNAVSAHNSAAHWERAMGRVAGAHSQLTSALSAMGYDMPGAYYSDLELGDLQRSAQEELELQIKDAKGSGASKYKIMELEKQLEQVKNITWKKSGQNVGASWSSGVANGITNNRNQISNAAAQATAPLRGRSPPKVGPLKQIDEWGRNIGSAFIDGMNTGLSDLNIPTPTVIGKGLGSGGDTIINVNLDNIRIGDESQAETVGVKIAKGLSKKLSGQANTAGVNVNITRG